MKKKFLIKIAVVFFVFIFSFLLQWKIAFGKSICKLTIQKMQAEKYFLPASKTNINGYGIFPFEDFFIKI